MIDKRSVKSFIKKLDEIKNTKIEDIIKNASAKIRDEARIRVPVDTAELQYSIRYRIEKKDGDRVVGVIYTNKEYAPYVEFGTGPKGASNHQGISPEVSPRYSPVGWSYFDKDEGKWWYTTGQKAQPFMYPALHDNRKQMKKYIKNEMRKKLKEVCK